jgi:DNA-binding transcriptional ArsR family regulator
MVNLDSAEVIASIDKLIHEPARLAIMMLLYGVESADFIYLKTQTGLTQGNLSSHLGKLETAGYVDVEKLFEGKIPRTLYCLTDVGRESFRDYIASMQNVLNGLSE